MKGKVSKHQMDPKFPKRTLHHTRQASSITLSFRSVGPVPIFGSYGCKYNVFWVSKGTFTDPEHIYSLIRIYLSYVANFTELYCFRKVILFRNVKINTNKKELDCFTVGVANKPFQRVKLFALPYCMVFKINKRCQFEDETEKEIFTYN